MWNIQDSHRLHFEEKNPTGAGCKIKLEAKAQQFSKLQIVIITNCDTFVSF